MTSLRSPWIILCLAVLGFAARHTALEPLVGRPALPVDPEVAAVESGSSRPVAGSNAAVTGIKNPERGPRKGTIERNSSLYEGLRSLGVGPLEIEALVRATRGTYDLRRVRAGQSFDLYATGAGGIDSLILHTGAEEYVRIYRDGLGFAARVEKVPYEVSYQVTEGIIHQSIFASLQAQGAETEIASSLDEIFGWTVDFFSDLRAGDSYAVLYERRTYANGHTSLGNVLAARLVNDGREHHAIRYRAKGAPAGYYDLAGQSLQKSMRRAPLKFSRVTSSFSNRRFHPVQKRYKPHFGVDYGAPRGTPVYATGDGLILDAGYASGNGNFIKIHHGRSYASYYLHLSGFAKGIRRGVRVTQGQLIGYVGSTGLATGPHLCYRIQRNGQWVNPRKLVLPSKGPIPSAEIAGFENLRDAYLGRIHETLFHGVEDQTVAVERPVRVPVGAHAAMF